MRYSPLMQPSHIPPATVFAEEEKTVCAGIELVCGVWTIVVLQYNTVGVRFDFWGSV